MQISAIDPAIRNGASGPLEQLDCIVPLPLILSLCPLPAQLARLLHGCSRSSSARSLPWADAVRLAFGGQRLLAI